MFTVTETSGPHDPHQSSTAEWVGYSDNPSCTKQSRKGEIPGSYSVTNSENNIEILRQFYLQPRADPDGTYEAKCQPGDQDIGPLYSGTSKVTNGPIVVSSSNRARGRALL